MEAVGSVKLPVVEAAVEPAVVVSAAVVVGAAVVVTSPIQIHLIHILLYQFLFTLATLKSL